ncbi:hypothetical protein KY313_03625 [Candidatus Woesearchaeota archaeon]|nr:hypothetical protein [Candidatus Woesearchaeota archaeon]
MIPFKNYTEAFNKKPEKLKDLKSQLTDANMLDWYPFLALVFKGFDNKNLMAWEFKKVGKGKGVSGQQLGLKIQPGTFYLLTMDSGAKKLWKKMWPDLDVEVETSGSEPKLWLGKNDMKWSKKEPYNGDGEPYDYGIKIIAGLGSGAAKGPDGAQWESVITYHVNNLLKKPDADPAAKEVAMDFIDYAPQGVALGKAFKKELGISTNMKQFGKGSAKTSKIWKDRSATNTTPKTDMYTGNYNISLKKDGGSQLASGTSAETLAMFDAALEYMGEEGSPIVQEIMGDIDTGFKKVTIEYNKTEMETIVGGGTVRGTSVKGGKLSTKGKVLPKEKQDALKKYTETEAFHKALNVKLTDTFEKLTDNQEFVKWFCFEAMSGYKKFEGDKLARASTCITFNPDKATVSRVDITPNGGVSGLGKKAKVGADLAKKAKSVKIYAAWKSSGKNPYSSLRVAFKKVKTKDIIDDINKDEELLLNSTLDSIIRDQILLDEDIKSLGLNLTEDIVQLDEFALLKSVFNKLKNIGKNASKWLQGFFDKVFAQVGKVLKVIAKLGEKMFTVLFRFLGIEVDKVTTSGVPSDIDYFFNK